MSNLAERLDNLRGLIRDSDFLSGKGLANEINIRIFCYDAAEEMIVRHFIGKLTAERNLGCRPIEYNLYKIFLDICADKKILDKIACMEKQRGTQFVLEQLRRIADNKAFVARMLKVAHNSGDVILISGVGEVFPFIRVHNLLEAMQPHFSDAPIVVMYPGTFDGRNLKLFDRLPPAAYYRAFNAI